MRTSIASIGLLLLLAGCAGNQSTLSCGPSSPVDPAGPIGVFEAYSEELHRTKEPGNFQFSKYLTERADHALNVRIENYYSAEMIRMPTSRTVNGVPAMTQSITMTVKPEDQEKMLAILLKNLKIDAVISKKACNTQEINQETAELESVLENYPEEGTIFTRTVFFKNEDGWKIDRINATTEMDGIKQRYTTHH